MGICCKSRFPCPHSVQNLANYTTRRIHESCQGAQCSRSCTPAKPRAPLWEPKPGPYSPRQIRPIRPQTAPNTVGITTSYQPYIEDRPASAQSNRSNRSNISYESCQYSNCSRSPCSTPRKFDEAVQPYEPKRPISPAGWTYSPKRITRRGRWWDKDWKIAERSNHYYDPNLQDCGCPFTKVHADSRTPSPPRSPRAIGIQYHFNRLAEEANRSSEAKRAKLIPGRDENGSGFQGFGHSHRYNNWSCGSSKNQSRSATPKARIRSRTPSPPRSTSSASPRERAPLKQRPQTPRGQQTPFITSHGHCHTYNNWSCTPSNRNTPGAQSPARSRSPTPPRPATPGTTTIKVSYSPPPEQESPRPLCCCATNQNLSDANSASPLARLFVSRHCHHCQYYHTNCPTCPSCGHSHGHHGQTLFTLAPSPPAPIASHGDCHGHQHHHNHHHYDHHHGHHHHPCQCYHHCHH